MSSYMSFNPEQRGEADHLFEDRGKSDGCLRKSWNWCKGLRERLTKSDILFIFLIIGVIIGMVCGVIIQTQGPIHNDVAILVELPGTVLLNILKSIVVILIPTSVITGIASIDVSKARSIACRSIAFYIVTTIIAIAGSMVWVSLIKPGSWTFGNESIIDTTPVNVSGIQMIVNIVNSMFPDNYITAAVNFNFLALIVFSIVIGTTISVLGQDGEPLLKFILSLNSVIVFILDLVLWYLPIGVCFLIMFYLGTADDILSKLGQLGMLVLTLMIGLTFHAFIVMPILYFIFVRRNPYHWYRKISPALMTAFGTSSSSATLPVTIECIERAGVPPYLGKFMLPLGATLNMDGGALYESMVAVFVAQTIGRDLNAGNIFLIFFVATVVSIGTPGIPNAGMISTVLVLTTLNLPLDVIGILMSIDWFIDRCRTTVNVLGDCIAVACVGTSLGLIDHEMDYSSLNHNEHEVIESDYTPDDLVGLDD